MSPFSSLFQESDFILQSLKNVLTESEEMRSHEIALNEGEYIFHQGDQISDLYVLLDGAVSLLRSKQPAGIQLVADTLKPGSFFGLIAFVTGNPSMTTARVDEAGQALKIRQDEFEAFLAEHPNLQRALQQLLMNNLVERYRHTIDLHLQMEELNKKLKKERNDLKKAYKELEETQNLLVHKEKMATLGQLVAGFAHEINNPTSALIRSAESVIEQMPKLFEEQYDEARTKKFLFRSGLQSKVYSSEEVRERMKAISGRFPNVKRTTLRKLAQMSDAAIEKMEDKTGRSPLGIEDLVPYYDAGKLLNNISLASDRISSLVKSLKSYSRQDRDVYEWIDVRDGIENTLQVLSNRVKYHEVHLMLGEIPKIYASGGELNQVWTNIIMNACDAMDKKGELWIAAGSGHPPEESLEQNKAAEDDFGQASEEAEMIWVRFEDSGPGLDESTIEKIFEPNFTTKRQSTQFGLGLGLTISNNIITKHGGHIEVGNRKSGGACFTVYLPVQPSGEVADAASDSADRSS